jgi:hypothetical protein
MTVQVMTLYYSLLLLPVVTMLGDARGVGAAPLRALALAAGAGRAG